MQCMKPCSDETYDTRAFLDKMLENLDSVTYENMDPNAIPKCLKCGGKMFMNVRGGRWFIEKPYEKQQSRFQNWIQTHLDTPLLLLDMGTGFDTPSSVRWPMEQITYHNSESFLLRFNRDYPDVPKEIVNLSKGIQMDINKSIGKIYQMNSLKQ